MYLWELVDYFFHSEGPAHRKLFPFQHFTGAANFRIWCKLRCSCCSWESQCFHFQSYGVEYLSPLLCEGHSCCCCLTSLVPPAPLLLNPSRTHLPLLPIGSLRILVVAAIAYSTYACGWRHSKEESNPIVVAGAASKDSQSRTFSVPRPVAAVTTSHPRCT